MIINLALIVYVYILSNSILLLCKLDNIAVTELKGVANKVAQKLAKLNITSIQDLLFHLPLRYEDRTQIFPIADVYPGAYATITTIINSYVSQGRKRMLICEVQDASGQLRLRLILPLRKKIILSMAVKFVLMVKSEQEINN